MGTVVPARLLDTRPDGETVDGEFEAAGKVQAGTFTKVQIAGRGNVPADAVGVELNITSIQNEGRGFATLYPCTATPPTASTLNYTPGVNIANATTVALNSSGEVCVFTSDHLPLRVGRGGLRGSTRDVSSSTARAGLRRDRNRRIHDGPAFLDEPNRRAVRWRGDSALERRNSPGGAHRGTGRGRDRSECHEFRRQVARLGDDLQLCPVRLRDRRRDCTGGCGDRCNQRSAALGQVTHGSCGTSVAVDLSAALSDVTSLVPASVAGISVSLTDGGQVAVAAAAGTAAGQVDVVTSGSGCVAQVCDVAFTLDLGVTTAPLVQMTRGVDSFTQPSPDRLAAAIDLAASEAKL